MTTRTRLGRALGVSAVLHFTVAIASLVLLTSQADIVTLILEFRLH